MFWYQLTSFNQCFTNSGTRTQLSKGFTIFFCLFQLIIMNIIITLFCPKAGPSLHAQEPRLQFCRRQVFHRTQEPKLQFHQELNRCGSFPLLSVPHSLFSILTDPKGSRKIPEAPTWRWGEWIWLTGPSELHRDSPQGLNISSIRVFLIKIRGLEISITFRPHNEYTDL